MIGEIDYFTHEQHGVTDWYRNNKPVKEQGYTTTLLGNDAVKFIDNHRHRDPVLSLSRLQRAAHALSGAAGIP